MHQRPKSGRQWSKSSLFLIACCNLFMWVLFLFSTWSLLWYYFEFLWFAILYYEACKVVISFLSVKEEETRTFLPYMSYHMCDLVITSKNLKISFAILILNFLPYGETETDIVWCFKKNESSSSLCHLGKQRWKSNLEPPRGFRL